MNEEGVYAVELLGAPSAQNLYVAGSSSVVATLAESPAIIGGGYVYAIIYSSGEWEGYRIIVPEGYKLIVRGAAVLDDKPVILGRLVRGNSSWALVAPINMGKAFIFNTSEHGGAIIDAAGSLNELRLYYRPGAFWDAVVEARLGEGRAWYSRLLWPYSHAVVVNSLDSDGDVVTATVLSPSNDVRMLVITRGFTTRPAILWHDGQPVFYVKKPNINEDLHVGKMDWPAPEPFNPRPRQLDYSIVELRVTKVRKLGSPVELSMRVDYLTVLGLYTAYALSFAGVAYYAFEPRGARD